MSSTCFTITGRKFHVNVNGLVNAPLRNVVKENIKIRKMIGLPFDSACSIVLKTLCLLLTIATSVYIIVSYDYHVCMDFILLLLLVLFCYL